MHVTRRLGSSSGSTARGKQQQHEDDGSRNSGNSISPECAIARDTCIHSERALARWKATLSTDPIEASLPGMIAVSLTGDVAVSIHDDRLTRVWDVTSRRRIASHQHKAKSTVLTCCDARGDMAAVGTAKGTVSVYALDDDSFQPSLSLAFPPPPPHAAATNGDTPTQAAVSSVFNVSIPPEAEHYTRLDPYTRTRARAIATTSLQLGV